MGIGQFVKAPCEKGQRGITSGNDGKHGKQDESALAQSAALAECKE